MTEQPHLEDEALSAVLDGEGTSEETAHVDACGVCEARLQVLRDASLLVRTPVSPAGDAERDAAIVAALASTTTTATVQPLRRRRPAPVWLAAAAAVAVVVLGVAVVIGRGDDDGSSGDFAAERTTAADSGGSSAGAAPNAATGAPVVDGGDLGAVQVAKLRTTIDAAMGTTRESAADTAGGATAPSTSTDCEASVRAGNPDLGPLVYRARGTLDGAPVAVLAFDTGDRRWVYVVDDACAIRNQTTYAPSSAP